MPYSTFIKSGVAKGNRSLWLLTLTALLVEFCFSSWMRRACAGFRREEIDYLHSVSTPLSEPRYLSHIYRGTAQAGTMDKRCSLN